jgi:AsmA protein
VPLLKKQVVVDTVRLSGLELNLAKDKNGRTNWDDLVEAADKETEQQDADAGESGMGGMKELAIGGIEITDARLVWDDRAAGSRYEIDELSLTTGEIATNETFDIDLQFRMAVTEPEINSRFSMTGGVLIAEGMQAVTVDAARIGLDATGKGVPGNSMQMKLSSDVALDLEAGTLSLPAVLMELYNLKINGAVSGTGVNGDAPKFTGNLRVDGFSPRELIKALGQPVPETADSSVLNKADASIDWDASTKHFAAGKVLLHLDDTTVNGSLGVTSFAAPAIKFNLAVDGINVDRYMPPPPAEGEAAAEKTAGSESAELPMEALRKLNLNGTITVAEMTAINLKYRDAKLQVTANDGVVRLNPFGAKMYDGSYAGDITMDVRGKKPRLSVNERVSGVQAGPLLKDLTGNDRLLGKADVSAKFTGTGITPDDLKRTLSGTATFAFTDGAVKGVNIAALLRNAQAKLKGQPAPAADSNNQTDFAVLSGTANVTNGLVRNDDLTLQSPFLRISGKGQTHLAEETIDYTLTTKLVGSLEGQGGKSLDELKGVPIPVRVGGTYSKPTYTPDLAAALSETAKAKVEEKVEKEKDKLKEKIEKKIGDKLLDGLFK